MSCLVILLIRSKLQGIRDPEEIEEHQVPATSVRQLFLKDPNGVKLELNFSAD
jgi:hypothetical protein